MEIKNTDESMNKIFTKIIEEYANKLMSENKQTPGNELQIMNYKQK